MASWLLFFSAKLKVLRVEMKATDKIRSLFGWTYTSAFRSADPV